MSSSLYKIVEVYDKKENKWKLAHNGERYEFPCSLALRDHLRIYNLADVNRGELSEELQEFLKKQDKEESFMHYNYHWLDMSTLEEIRETQWNNIVDSPYRKIKCDTNTKLNLILDDLGIQKLEDFECEETSEDLREYLSCDLELALGVERDVAEINMLARLYADSAYDNEKRIIVYYC